MVTRTLMIAAIAAGFATPMLASASTSSQGFDSCVKAFMADMSNSNRGRVALKLRGARFRDHSMEGGEPSSINGNRELELVARDAHDHHVVASASCTVTAQGDLVALHDAPLWGSDSF
jgi:hypothetical protein